MINVNMRKRSNWNDELRKETVGVWKEAVDLFNQIDAATRNFPLEDKADLKNRITELSKRMTDKIANSATSRSQADFEERLKHAIDLVHETMAQLYVAKQWNYVSESFYEQLFERGRTLVGKLCLFGGFTYAASDAGR